MLHPDIDFQHYSARMNCPQGLELIIVKISRSLGASGAGSTAFAKERSNGYQDAA